MVTINRARSYLIGRIDKHTVVKGRPCSSSAMVSQVRHPINPLPCCSPFLPNHTLAPYVIYGLLSPFALSSSFRLVRSPACRRPLCQSDRGRRKRQPQETLRQGRDSVHSVPRFQCRQGDRWGDRRRGEDQRRLLDQACRSRRLGRGSSGRISGEWRARCRGQ